MQNPNDDTEWNDALRKHGILPKKPAPEKEITEDEIVNMVNATIQEKVGGSTGKPLEKLSLDDLDDLEDEEEEAVLQRYRQKRLDEMKSELRKTQFGDVLEISAQDYVKEVNKAGDGIWVVLLLYKQGIPMCSLLNQFMNQLAKKFPTTKFIRSISTVCIPNYPDKNVPTVFIYYEGEMKKQFIGEEVLRGMKLTIEEFEYILGKIGAVKSSITKDPKPKIEDALMSRLGGGGRKGRSDSESD